MERITTVFLVWHDHQIEGESNEKLLGIFSSRLKAEQRVREAGGQLGFEDFPDGFTIDMYKLDESQWTDGFITE